MILQESNAISDTHYIIASDEAKPTVFEEGDTIDINSEEDDVMIMTLKEGRDRLPNINELSYHRSVRLLKQIIKIIDEKGKQEELEKIKKHKRNTKRSFMVYLLYSSYVWLQ